jgi:hypothetical protein
MAMNTLGGAVQETAVNTAIFFIWTRIGWSYFTKMNFGYALVRQKPRLDQNLIAST